MSHKRNSDERCVVTVDGLAGSGKTSLSRELARSLGFVHFNSGLLYRAVGFLALNERVSTDDESALEKLVAAHQFTFSLEAGELRVMIDSRPIAGDLRTPEVSEATSQSSRFLKVRALLLPIQRLALPDRALVAEGRDMGTVVFPDAPVKFFVQASVEVRCARRIKELYGDNPLNSPADVKRAIEREIIERDERDALRAHSPTVAAQGAVLIDNSVKSFATVVQEMVQIVKNKCG